MPAAFSGFPAEALKFLRDLQANNRREWFQPRKHEYEEYVKQPMIDLVLALGDELENYGVDLVTAPQKAIYRLYRDVRFSKDKSPYKAHVSAIFSPRGMQKHAGAALYFHVAPEEVFIAGGIYAPGPKELLAVRRLVAGEADRLREITGSRSFRRLFGEMGGEKLKRVPKGFPADHPERDLLVHKQFIVAAKLPVEIAETPKLYNQLVKRFRVLEPFVVFLNSPLV